MNYRVVAIDPSFKSSFWLTSKGAQWTGPMVHGVVIVRSDSQITATVLIRFLKWIFSLMVSLFIGVFDFAGEMPSFCIDRSLI